MNDDDQLLESVATHRRRLRQAFLFGSPGARRKVSTLLAPLFASVVIAAIAAGACAGVSFATHLSAQNATPTPTVPATSSSGGSTTPTPGAP
jgi:hypothetical protein